MGAVRRGRGDLKRRVENGFPLHYEAGGRPGGQGTSAGNPVLELLRDGFYIETAAGRPAGRRDPQSLRDRGYPFLVPNNTNQIFPVIPTPCWSWKDKYAFRYQCRVDESHSAVRFCTSWATRPEDGKPWPTTFATVKEDGYMDLLRK